MTTTIPGPFGPEPAPAPAFNARAASYNKRCRVCRSRRRGAGAASLAVAVVASLFLAGIFDWAMWPWNWPTRPPIQKGERIVAAAVG